jgi:hypothetical protein
MGLFGRFAGIRLERCDTDVIQSPYPKPGEGGAAVADATKKRSPRENRYGSSSRKEVSVVVADFVSAAEWLVNFSSVIETLSLPGLGSLSGLWLQLAGWNS